MPYYGRQVARLKGVGKYINWNQGGGPKKAGLGPSVDVTTWGRRVIARRTNNCCCDPIELTSIQLSIPGGWRLADNPWNYIQSGTNENLPSGLVGPPRNDIDNNVIHTERQIYSIVTFNKPISQNINMLGNIEECGDIIGPGNYEFGQTNFGTGRMTFLPSGTGSQQSFNNPAINGIWINSNNLNGDSFLAIIQNLIHFGKQGLLIERTDDGYPNNYMILKSNTGFVLDSLVGLPVIKAPGGTVTTGPPIWVEGNGNVLGSIPPGPQGLKISLANCINTNPSKLSLPLTGLKIAKGVNTFGNTVQIQPRTTSTANTRYYDLVTVSTPVVQIPGGTKINTFLPTLLNNQTQNYSGYLLTGSRVIVEDAPGLSGLGTRPSTTINKISKPEGRALVDMADGQNNTFEKFQSAIDDTKFRGNNNDPWQQGEGGSIVTEYFGAYSTPLMDVSNNGFAIKSSSLKTPTKDYYNRYIGNGFGIYTNNRRCSDPLPLGSIPPNNPRRNIALIQGDYANNQNEFYSADAMYISTGPVKWLNYDYALFINITSIMQVTLKNSTSRSGATSLVGPPLQPGQPNTITTNTLQYWNQAEKPIPPAVLGGPVAQSDAGPWQGWGIKPLPFGLPPVTPPLAMPAWSDLIGSAYGMAISQFVTLDASNVEQYALGPVTVYFPNPTYNPDIIGATLGDVVEKMRQITFTAFPSYIIKNLLNSKYRCGNDGFDGPVDDITLPSLNLDNRIISSANENEGGILTIE